MGTTEANFGRTLKRLIGDAGLTVEAFARQLDVHVDSPQKWFAGKSYPHRKYHKRMAEILGVPVERLFAAEGPSANLESMIPAPVATGTVKERPEMENELLKSLLRRLDSIDMRLASVEGEIRELRSRAHDHGPLASTPRHRITR